MASNEGMMMCDHCHGRRFISGGGIILAEVCPTCGGFGQKDWIDNAMGKSPHPNQSIEYQVAQRNIDRLMEAIRLEGEKVGVRINVKLEHIHPDKYFNEYISYPKSIYKGDMYVSDRKKIHFPDGA